MICVGDSGTYKTLSLDAVQPTTEVTEPATLTSMSLDCNMLFTMVGTHELLHNEVDIHEHMDDDEIVIPKSQI